MIWLPTFGLLSTIRSYSKAVRNIKFEYCSRYADKFADKIVRKAHNVLKQLYSIMIHNISFSFFPKKKGSIKCSLRSKPTHENIYPSPTYSRLVELVFLTSQVIPLHVWVLKTWVVSPISSHLPNFLFIL